MLKKSIRKEDLKKIKEEILQVLEGSTVFDWPGLFKKVWPEGRFSVTDALLEFFRLAPKECFPFKAKISDCRIRRVVKKIFDYFKEAETLLLNEVYRTDCKTFDKALDEIRKVFKEHTEIVLLDHDDVADEKDIGHETGVAY